MKKLLILGTFMIIVSQACHSCQLPVRSAATNEFFRLLHTQPHNIDALMACHAQGADIQCRITLGTALHALVYGTANKGGTALARPTLEFLLAQGIDPRTPDFEGKSSLDHLLELHQQTQGHFLDDIVLLQQWIASHPELPDLARLSLNTGPGQ